MEENVIQTNSGITINVDVSVRNVMYVKKSYIWNSFICSCENGKYLANAMNDSAIRCDEIIESTTIPVNFNEKKATCRMQNSHILLAFLLITITLLIGVIIYYYLIKY